MRHIVLAVLFLSVAVGAATAQNEGVLRRFFEGKEVKVLLEMPGDTSGIDIHPERESPVDFRRVGDSIRRYGVAIKKGDSVMVTKVHVKKKLIEFQFEGGGFGSFSDYMNETAVPGTYVGKSEREKSLEIEKAAAMTNEQRDKIQHEIDREKSDRRRESARLQMEASQAKIMRDAQEKEQRLRSGSRFTIRYKHGVPPDALTPQGLMKVLAKYVEFPPELTGAPLAQAKLSTRGTLSPVGGASVAKGMTEQQVGAIYGKPVNRDEQVVSGMKIVKAKYENVNTELSAQFVDGVLTKYTISTK